MPWGGNKRQRNVERCHECEHALIDTLHDEDWGFCGDCQQGVMCGDCCKLQCDVCTESERNNLELIALSSFLCQTCVESCNDCEYLFFHRCCREEHLKRCNAKSRAKRRASAAAHRVSETETQLSQAKQQLEALQRRVDDLECSLEIAKEEKTMADNDLEAETGNEASNSEAKPAALKSEN